jgi:hypothetical protein
MKVSDIEKMCPYIEQPDLQKHCFVGNEFHLLTMLKLATSTNTLIPLLNWTYLRMYDKKAMVVVKDDRECMKVLL